MAERDGSALHYEWLSPLGTTFVGPPVVLLHGFTQNTRCWGPFGSGVSSRHTTLAIDAPGHGGSTQVRSDLRTSADLLARTLHAAVGRPSIVIGYSMGGRLGLHVALRRPDLVAALVLIGATAGIEDDAERSARLAADDALAEHLLAMGVEEFIDEWLAQPLFAGLTPTTACRDERLSNEADGLASSLRLAGTGAQEPLWDQLDGLAMPVLVLAGEEDAKFRALGTRLADHIGPNADLAIVEGAGHAVQLERPAETAALIEAWLSDVGTIR